MFRKHVLATEVKKKHESCFAFFKKKKKGIRIGENSANKLTFFYFALFYPSYFPCYFHTGGIP